MKPVFNLVRPIVCDFETFYSSKLNCSAKANVKQGWVGGPYFYTHHKLFSVYMMAVYDPISKERFVTDDRNKFKEVVRSFAGRTIIAANCGFEEAVIKHIDPDFQIFNMFDVLNLSAYFQCPRHLDGAAQHLLGKTISKEIRNAMDGVEYSSLGIDQKDALKDYALTDAVIEGEIFEKYHTAWPDLEKWISDYTRIQNSSGVHIDSNYLEDQIDIVNQVRSKAISQIPWCESDEDTPLSAKKLSVWCREQNITPPESLAEDSEECTEWEEKYGDTFPVVGAMRDFRKSNTLMRKLNRITLSLRPDGTMPMDCLYAAAPHTLRFSSRGVNVQNLPREATICDLRGCLVPAPDHSFIGSDLAGIEARCLPYLADDMDYLNEVARLDSEAADGETGDLYEPAARRMFNYSDPRPLRKADKPLRVTTKTCVLALGYQSGANKFNSTITRGTFTIPPAVLERVLQKGETVPELAYRLVKLYRSTNPKVPTLWYGLDRELRTAHAAGIDFKVQLPNGRTINYFNLMSRESKDQNGNPRVEIVGSVCKDEPPKKLYGGKITENITQGMARDVFVHAIYNLVQSGVRVRFGVHDEAVCEVPLEIANRDMCRRIEQIMSRTPDWAPGLPLAAEATVMKRYAK